MKKCFAIGVLCMLFVVVAKAQGPCEITASIDKGCIPLPVSFSFKSSYASPVVSYHWQFGSSDSSSQPNPRFTFFKGGTYYVTIKVKFKDGTVCTDSLKKPIIIYSNPNVDFDVNNSQSILLCQRGQKVCFKDKSSPGADKAPIKGWQWSFGDGSFSTAKNPCYAYSDSGTYLVTLDVTDSNGCKNFIQKKVSIRFTTDLGINVSPAYTVYLAYDCKKNVENVLFTNTTDTAYNYITKFIWDFADGKKDSCDLRTPGCLANWTGFSHTYSVTGVYKPSLYIENKYGCGNKVVLDTPIIIDPFKLDVEVFPDHPGCYNMDSTIAFLAPFNTYAKSYQWDFGDPLSRSTGVLPATMHTYKAPGIYSVYLKVLIGKCLYDTVLCKRIKLYGPIAKIMPYKGISETWDRIPPGGSYLITPSAKATYFDTTCLGASYKTYYTYKSTFIPNGEAIYDKCKVDTIKTVGPDSMVNCNKKKIPNIINSYKRHVASYKDTTVQIATQNTWYKGTPWPGGTVYSKPPFINNPLFLDDSSLFSLRCKAPQKITFTNFSEKYRGYDAVDNFPPGYPSLCKNPSYPYASDSLTYLWNFGEGIPTTSTKAKPDTRAQLSSEKLPTHLFQKDGCYWVVLTVSDSQTNCLDQDSVPVVLQAPDAGWAPQYSSVKNMTRLIQDSLPAKGPRRGARVFGIPCLEDTQKINLNETLPSCYKPDFSMILDSAAQVRSCGKKIEHLWMSKDSIAKYFTYHFLYADTGWKTIGVVMRNNVNCTDTVWYHHYNYIHGTYPGIIPSSYHICPGDTLNMSVFVPQQLGIKTFVYYYAEEKDLGDTIAKPKSDTLRYRIIKHLKAPADTITSTVHNKDWGIDDGPLNFNYLTDVTRKMIPYPGHLTITTVIRSRFGCVDTARTQVTVGHYTDFSAANNVLCVNDTAHFNGLAQYFVPFIKGINDGYDQRLFWNNPDSARHGRKTKIPEQMQWDLDGDGVIDYTGTTPSFIYTKPGSYTVTMYTTDSSGCKQKLERKDFIKVVAAAAYFTVKSPGDTRFCNDDHFFQFQDSSYVIKSFKDSLNRYKIYSWTWDFGDGTPTYTQTDTAKRNATHVYVDNGDYTVTLTVRTAPGGGAGFKGCGSTFSRPVHIYGPVAHFSIVGPDKGCVPFTLKVRDESKQAKLRQWRLGDGTTVTSNGDSFVYLTYKRPGIFCPVFYVVDTLIDLQGNILYCADSFPKKQCELQVEVYKINVQALSASDTLLCLHRDSVVFRSVPDTGYKLWTLKFGDGDSESNVLPVFTYRYNKTGRYHAVISGTGAKCPDTSSVNVHVVDIKADFEVDTVLKDTPVFNFINHSVGGLRYTWDFGDGSPPVDTKSSDPIKHEFMRAGVSTVCLTAYNEKSCSEKICKDIKIDTFIMIPNVFSPNGDAHNNHYVITIYGNKLYDLDIFNRWGEKVFHSDDKNNTWDGTNHATGLLYPEGVYYAVLRYRFIGGRNQFAKTSVTLLRK